MWMETCLDMESGSCCRDRNYVFLETSLMIFLKIVDPATLESLAIRDPLALASDLYTSKILSGFTLQSGIFLGAPSFSHEF